MIQGHGAVGADIMLISDGASADDEGTGYAISGREAYKYNEFLKPVGITLQECWLTSLIKQRINLNKPEENNDLISDTYRAILLGEISSIKPRIILPLSELAFRFCTGLHGIRKFRGSILPPRNGLQQTSRILPILGLYPYLNQDERQYYITRLDFQKIPKVLHDSGPIKEVGITWIAKTAESLRIFIERQKAKQPKFLSFDIETWANQPTCISLCFDGLESVTVPLLDKRIALDQRVLMFHFVAKLLADESLPKGNQNVKFDWRKLERFGFRVSNITFDTMVQSGIIYPEFAKSLGFLSSIYTEMPYFKDEGKDFDPDSPKADQVQLYCAKDSLATWIINSKQQEEIDELGLREVVSNTIACLPIYKKMEENGIRVDTQVRDSLLFKYQCLYDIQVYKVRSLLNSKDFNPASPKQVNEVVFGNVLSYKPIRGLKRTTTGGLSTDEENLELLIWMSEPQARVSRFAANDILKTLISIRKLAKVLEYIETLIYPDNYMRYETNLVGTKTGRTSASSSSDYMVVYDAKTKKYKFENPGRSPQTISKHGFELDGETLGKDLRNMFVPSPGYSFVECDLSGAEARVDTVLAKDFDMLPIFDNGSGIHRLTGSWIYNCPVEEIKKGQLVDGVDRYHVSKTARHAAERNMKADRLMMMIHRPQKECQEILNTFHKRQPNIVNVFHREVQEALKKRVLVCPNGRRRDFFGKADWSMLNDGISFIPQGVVSDKTKFDGILPTCTELPWVRPLAEAHDGFLCEVPIGREQEYASRFKTNVEVPIDFRNGSLSRDYLLTIPCEVEVSKENWKNMEGLKI